MNFLHFTDSVSVRELVVFPKRKLYWNTALERDKCLPRTSSQFLHVGPQNSLILAYDDSLIQLCPRNSFVDLKAGKETGREGTSKSLVMSSRSQQLENDLTGMLLRTDSFVCKRHRS